jgi:hypothetical protein
VVLPFNNVGRTAIRYPTNCRAIDYMPNALWDDHSLKCIEILKRTIFEGWVNMDTDKLSVVPEVFYDIISRVPAGVLILIVTYIFLPTEQKLALLTIENFPAAIIVLPIIGLILSYAIGLGLTAPSHLLFFGFDRILYLIVKKMANNVMTSNSGNKILDITINTKKDLGRVRLDLHIFLKRQTKEIAMEMAKHQAESALFANLTSGFILLWLLFESGILPSMTQKLTISINCAFALMIISCAAITLYRQWNTWRYHFGYYRYFLQNPENNKTSM